MGALYDNHLHSRYSPDACDDFDDLCETALRQGMEGLTLTDHCDFGQCGLPDWRDRLAGSAAAALRARARFAGRLTVGVGVELGQPLQNLPLAREALASAPFDFVLCSLHELSDGEEIGFLGPTARDPRGLLTQYFDELIGMTAWGGFDSLAHLTYPYRYLRNPVPPVTDFEERLRVLFTALAHAGRALELNTSGRRNKNPFLPGLWELKLFRECGGELITLGSDSHRAAFVGSGIAEGAELLRAAGFSHHAVYIGREPRTVAL